MNILTMTADHLEGVALIERACFSAPWSEQSLELLLRDGNMALCALCDNTVAGYVGVLSLPPDEFDITNVAVHPDFRRRGLGESLMRALFETAQKQGVTRITLEVRVSNTPAISLYHKLGFCDCGKRKNFYSSPREDAIIMEKIL